jgi:hypothetical protein
MTTLWLLDARDRTETNPRKINLDDNQPMAHDRQDLIKQACFTMRIIASTFLNS